MEKGLKINVNSLAADPVAITVELDPRIFDLGSEARVREAVRVQVKVHRLGEKVYIRGQVETTVELLCSRCLRELAQEVRSPLLLLALQANQAVGHPSPVRLEGTEQDDSVGIVYTGDQVDLTPEIQSVLTLALPMKPLCSETCQGLCSQCGARVAEGSCDCPDQRGIGAGGAEGLPDGCQPGMAEGPFSVLKQWRP
jgi:uncharacterized protein